MADFSRQCRSHDALKNLKFITISHNADLHSWGDHLLDVLSTTSLEMFHISSSGGEARRALTDDFVEKLITAHGRRLKRFSVQRMYISMSAIEDICRRCHTLEELFVVVEVEDVVSSSHV